ncbi:unnamed protein product [Adineta ricciae]|uniref:Nucleosome assembly protein n=1 Tax=Adineta ricciae TaxID=249248 RepID=A0A814MTK2_ADIRI|nr:unnamed protein product [Adineta ricciae]CAF1083309.1 unnamed protein product [Adineta ricciae]
MSVDSSPLSIWSNCQPGIQHRINALLNYEAEYFRLRAEFHRQLQDLQYSYYPHFEQILEQRRQIINGSSNVSISNGNKPYIVSAKEGIPLFWLTVLKNLDSYDYPVRSCDEACLKHLTDIRCRLNPPSSQTTSFALEFHFSSSNPYFSETILTKHYWIRLQANVSSPYRSYDGPEIDRCSGCSISWNPNHDLTIRKRIKQKRNKITGEIRRVQVEERIPSFFDFFSPPIIHENGIQDMSDDDHIRLEADFQFGLLLKQQVIPKALLYYTGEALSPYGFNTEDSSSNSSS